MQTVLATAAWIVFAASAAAHATEYEPGTPFTYLFDTGVTSAEPLSAIAVRDKKGWTALAEDDVTHQFTGDAVLLNDRLAVVLRSKSPGAELYTPVGQASQPAGDLKASQPAGDLQASQPAGDLQASQPVVEPVPAAGGELKRTSLRILENTPAAVMVEASFQASDGSAAKLAFRLTTGQGILELRPGGGVQRVRLRVPSRYVAVPDFFGDDMVFRADGFSGSRLGLPAENFLLHFADGGNALWMCVWPSSRQQAAALLGDEGPRRTILGSEVPCVPGKNLWIAALMGPGIWHDRAVAAAEAPRETVLDWRPPFSAKWRASLAGGSGFGPSWYFRGADGGEEAESLEKSSPCCLDAQRAVVQFRPDLFGQTAPEESRSLVVYPIDRSRTTPLTTFCPIDILRATLGVGPCQYILQTEGLASDANPTPDSVMTFVEKQFSKKKEKKAADEIREMLAQMADHVEHAQKRIARYGALGRDVRRLCQGQPAGSAAARAAESLRPSLDRLEESAGAVADGATQPAGQVRKLAGEVASLIGKPDGAAECRRLGLEIRRLGALQDRALANARMAARWMRQQAAAWPTQSPDVAGLAEKTQARIDQTLGNQ